MPAYRKPTELLALDGAFEKNPQRRCPIRSKSPPPISDLPGHLVPDEAVARYEFVHYAPTGVLEGESGAFREQVKAERDRADQAEARAGQAEAEREAARAEREAAKVAAASTEGEAKGLRLALEEARRPFWRRWMG